MQPWIFLGAAFVLVAFGGLMAAVDSAISVSSRADLTDLALSSRARRSLLAIAEDTGGKAVVNTNDFARGFREIVRDNSTYYLVGYQPDPVHRDGEFHQLTVRVTRPGLTVRTRRGYLAATAADAPTVTATPVDELATALRNPVPRRDMSIEIAATPMQLKKRGKGVVAVPAGALRKLTADDVRDTLERVRR